jgi:hypothetical protein
MSGITYGGATLSIYDAVGTSYIAQFSITNVKLNGQTLTTDPAYWGGSGLTFPAGTSGGSYSPPGTAGGFLWLTDLNDTVLTTVPVSTSLAGDANVTFTIPVKPSYAYNLFYQTAAGTLSNQTGLTGLDISFISRFGLRAPPMADGGAFQALYPQTTSVSATSATVESVLFSYNNVPITSVFGTSFAGSIEVYKNAASGGLPQIGVTAGVTGTLVGSLKTTQLSSASGTIPFTYGITFDSQLGDFYMIYHPFTNDTTRSSENYVAVPPVYLPFNVSYTDFYGVSGTTAITVDLKDISYNYTGLTSGQQLLLVGPSGARQTLNTYLDSVGVASATFISYQSTAGSRVYFNNNGATSQSFYNIPTFVYGQEEFNANYSKSNISNNGFTINLTNFDYFDGSGHSIFDSYYYPTPATGLIRIIGPNYFFKEVRFVPGVRSYSFDIDASLPYAPTPSLGYTFSFVRDSVGVLPATGTYSTSWRGVQTLTESLNGNIRIAAAGTSVTINISDVDYVDIYGNSIFNSVYRSIEVGDILAGGNAGSSGSGPIVSGGTAGSSGATATYFSQFNPAISIPPSGTQLLGVSRSSTLLQNDSFLYAPSYSGATGIVYFGVTGTTGFAVGTNVVGSDTDGNSITGTVLSSSLSGLVVQVNDSVRSSGGASSSNWTFTGTYFEQPNRGHTGSIQLLDSLFNVVQSVPYVSGSVGYTLTTQNSSLSSSVPTIYWLAFYDATLGITRTSRIVANVLLEQRLGQELVGNVGNLTSNSFTFTGFDYLIYGSSILYPPGQTGGYLNLYSGPDLATSTLLWVNSVTGGTGTVYTFSSSTPLPPTAFIQYQHDPSSFFGTSYKQITMAASGQTGATFFGGWTGPSWQGLSMGSSGMTATFGFDYMYKGNAGQSVVYQLIAEVDIPIDTTQTITMKVPASELSRMLLYQSAWTYTDPGTGELIQYFINAGVSGSTAADPGAGAGGAISQVNAAGLTGPNIALLLNNVLNRVNLYDGPTLGQYTLLTNLDNRFTSSSGTRFIDDAGVTISSINYLYSGMTFGSSGSTLPSLLSMIPAETIASITNTGVTITALNTILQDTDTIVGASSQIAPALTNLFAECAAYGRADDKNPVSVAIIGASGATGVTAGYFFGPSGTTYGATAAVSSIAIAWGQAPPTDVFGVNFQPGDSILLYITYSFTKGRVFTLQPNVTQLLQTTYGFSIGNVASLVIGGKRIRLQVNDPVTGAVDLSAATADNNSDIITRVIGLKLLATASNAKTNTVFYQ